MIARDLPPKRLGDLQRAADDSPATPVPVYGGDLRALLAMRRELVSMRRAADPFVDGQRRDLVAKAAAATTSSARVAVPAADLRALLAMRAELLAYGVAAERIEREEAAALAAAGARVIKARSDDGKGRLTLVGPDHGTGSTSSRPGVPSDGKGRPSVRTYGFDLAHLAAFLGMHPESVRKAIRDGDLVPVDLASIFAFKLAALTHESPAVADAAEALKSALRRGSR